MKTKKLKRSIIFIFICLLSFHSNGFAQKFQASLSRYSTDDGLASNAIAQMVQDDYGFIWIATWNGLARFDGFNFYNYQTGASSGIPHLHNRIWSLNVDHSQNIWMRMYDGRVFVLNRLTDKIIDPLKGIGGHEDFMTNYPLFVTSGGDVMAFFNNVGIYKMRLDRNGLTQQLIMTSGLEVTSMAEGYHSDIWVGTNKGIHRIDMSNLNLERKGYFLDEEITCIFSNGYNVYAGTQSGRIVSFAYGQEPKVLKEVGEAITSLYVDSYGLIWYSDQHDGVNKFDLQTGTTKSFAQRILVSVHDSKGSTISETMGTVWISMNHGGYGYYNRETDEVEYFHNDPSNPWNLSNSVNASLELSEGVIWESTSRRGLEKLEILKNNISRTLLIPNSDLMIDNEIRAMYYDEARKLLFLGNKNNSLFVFKEDGSHSVISHDSSGHPIGRPYGISKDSKGNYWMCSKDYGLFKISPNGSGGYQIVNFQHNDKNNLTLSSNSAYAAVEDKGGNIWIATYGGGVNVLTRNSKGNYIFLHSKNAMKHYPYNSFMKVRTIAVDKDGNVWAGTTDGILIMSLRRNNITIQRVLPSEENPEKSLMSNDIVCLACDRKGTMWVGTNGGGLSHTIGKDKNGTWLFENYGAHNGLPSEEIKSITFDSKDNVWFGTDHILCSFDVTKKIFSSFSNLDGVDDTMCSEGAAISLPNGNILFGTLTGYYTVDRKKLTTSTGSLLKLRVTDFYLNDELQSPRLTNTFDLYIPEFKYVRTPSHNSEFAFRFASLNFQLQHRVHYQYIMEGYDKAWHNADKSRIAKYANLPTGSYQFKVKAFLLESPENYDLRTIQVVIPPHSLLSSKAIWGYLFIIAVSLLLLLYFYEKRLARKYQMSAAVEDVADGDAAPEAEVSDAPIEAEEKTDEYEIIED